MALYRYHYYNHFINYISHTAPKASRPDTQFPRLRETDFLLTPGQRDALWYTGPVSYRREGLHVLHRFAEQEVWSGVKDESQRDADVGWT